MPDDSDFGFFLQVDLSYPDNIKEKPRIFSLLLKKNHPENFTPHMNEKKLNNYIQLMKLICDWTDEKNYSIHQWMLIFYVRHGLVIDKLHEKICFKQGKW